MVHCRVTRMILGWRSPDNPSESLRFRAARDTREAVIGCPRSLVRGRYADRPSDGPTCGYADKREEN
jgi:hypothetical protein